MIAFLRNRAEWLMIVGFLPAALAVLCLLALPSARWRAAAFAVNPQVVTPRDLAANGFGDNPHVHVTDYACGEGYVVEVKTRSGQSPPGPEDPGFCRAWIPLLPKGQAAQPPTSFVALLKTTETLTNRRGILVLSRRPRMEALTHPVSWWNLSSETQAQLAEHYPDTDFTRCILLEQYEPREKAFAPTFAALLLAGAVAGSGFGVPLLALGLFFLWQRRKVEPDVGYIRWKRKRSDDE